MAAAPGGLLGGLAQGGVAAERAGLDQQEGVGVELAGGVAGQRLGGQLVEAGLLACRSRSRTSRRPPISDWAASSPSSRAGVAVEVAVGELGHVEGSSGSVGDLRGQLLAALAHHAQVAAIDQGGADLAGRAWPGSARYRAACRGSSPPASASAPWARRARRWPARRRAPAGCAGRLPAAARSWASCWAAIAGVGLVGGVVGQLDPHAAPLGDVARGDVGQACSRRSAHTRSGWRRCRCGCRADSGPRRAQVHR